MNKKIEAIQMRREILLARCELQRARFAEAIAPLQQPATLIDHAVDAVRGIASHPFLLLLGTVGIFKFLPKAWLGKLARSALPWVLSRSLFYKK